MRYLSVIKYEKDSEDHVIVSQIETTLTDGQAIEIENLLQSAGMLKEDYSLAITESV